LRPLKPGQPLLMYSHSLKEHCNTLVNVLEMELISLTRVPYNYIDQGNSEVNNGRAAEAEMFKMGGGPVVF